MKEPHVTPLLWVILTSSFFIGQTRANYSLEWNKWYYDYVNKKGACYTGTRRQDGKDLETIKYMLPGCEKTSLELTEEQIAYFESLHNDVREKPVIRREIRQYKRDELNEIFSSIKQMKNTFIGNISEYDIFVSIHRPLMGPSGTRSGPSTWGWHREYLFRFENAMRRHKPAVSLPYWDTTLDQYLPNMYHSIIWTDSFTGKRYIKKMKTMDQLEGDCTLTTGPFAYWPLFSTCAKATSHVFVTRGCQDRVPHISITDYDLMYTLTNKTRYSGFSYDLCLISDHDELHGTVGGVTVFPGDKSCAVEDPIMWFAHTYFDYIWELFRKAIQTTDIETEYYPDSLTVACHRANETMTPFTSLRNIDGLTKNYTDVHYIYEKTMHFCHTDEQCGSFLYWCDQGLNRCKSKVYIGGNCKGLPDNACIYGKCVNNSKCTIIDGEARNPNELAQYDLTLEDVSGGGKAEIVKNGEPRSPPRHPPPPRGRPPKNHPPKNGGPPPPMNGRKPDDQWERKDQYTDQYDDNTGPYYDEDGVKHSADEAVVNTAQKRLIRRDTTEENSEIRKHQYIIKHDDNKLPYYDEHGVKHSADEAVVSTAQKRLTRRDTTEENSEIRKHKYIIKHDDNKRPYYDEHGVKHSADEAVVNTAQKRLTRRDTTEENSEIQEGDYDEVIDMHERIVSLESANSATPNDNVLAWLRKTKWF